MKKIRQKDVGLRSLIKIFCAFAMLISFGAHAQNKTISGKVTSASTSESLPGVSVLVKGTTTGTVTDIDGAYTLSVNSDNAVLVFSFIGMQSVEMAIGGRSVLDVNLEDDVESLDEVIVVGYGTQKKSDIISSVVSVSVDKMLKIPSSDIGEMMRGKATGVFVTTANAEPGSSTNIAIRGKRTLAAFDGTNSNAPIVIADGVQIGGINDINPNDIASMEILKDAAAQAIYGARAANGVIVITTKRGKSGKATVSYNGFYGVQQVKRTFDIYSAEEFAQLKREAFRADNNNNYLPDEDIFTATELRVLENGQYVDWEKELIEIAPISSHNIGFSAGNETSSVYAGVNYLDQKGVVKGTDFNRTNIRFNADQVINSWLKIGLNTSWQLSTKNNPGTGNALQRSITTSPLGEIYNEDGTLKLYPTDVAESQNPLMDITETTNLQDDRNDIMNVFMDVTPFKGFKYRLNVSRRSWNRKTTNYSTGESLTGLRNNGQGSGSLRYEDSNQKALENIFTYDFDLGGSKHKVNLTAVQSIIEDRYNSFTNRASLIPNDLLGIYGLEAAATNLPEIDGNKKTLISFVGRVQYDFSGKYYFNASIRKDGSSVFGANNKWAAFPAVAAGWNVHREQFMTGMSSTISVLKLRASYGSVGNTAIPAYKSQALANQRNVLFNGVKTLGYVPGDELPNPDLKWETSTTLNLALDFGLWASRLSGTVEFYNTSTKDLLVRQNVNVTGYKTTLANIGEMQNRGVELSLNAVLIEKEDLVVNAGVNITSNRNKILHLYGTDEDGDGVEDDDEANRWFIGQPSDVYYQWKPVGIFQIGEDIANSHQPTAVPGDIKMYDRFPDDGILNADDRVITQRGPTWYGSFNMDATFKGFDVAVSVYAVQGVVKNNNYLFGYSQGGSLRGIYNGVKQDYWTPENPTGNWPRPSEANDRQNIWAMGLQDASYLRLQNLTLGYSLPDAVLAKVKLSKIRLYLTGQNLFTKTNFSHYSPESYNSDTEGYYPESTTVLAGLQIGF